MTATGCFVLLNVCNLTICKKVTDCPKCLMIVTQVHGTEINLRKCEV